MKEAIRGAGAEAAQDLIKSLLRRKHLQNVVTNLQRELRNPDVIAAELDPKMSGMNLLNSGAGLEPVPADTAGDSGVAASGGKTSTLSSMTSGEAGFVSGLESALKNFLE